ncbi:hypothetical protein PK28_16930 (plasmid) [Hymenobacter sp. DG25B]|uniref:hypothetical protein n=1 Tax=Hymenobacter sp. DG25B TaxID=1385664 RepID=UPI000540AF60|nr:hypothetical protein [Hymenobacter sp. DG25B]AIZ65360.1 hypothetical protein PK28_16930 [Hymenobacter sp. DG25B]
MTVFFDKANLEALLRTHGQAGQAETLKMLRGEVDVAINFTMQDVMASGASRDVLSKFVGQMTVGRKQTKFRFMQPAYPARPITLTFYTQPLSHRRPVVMADDTEMAGCKAAGTCLVGTVGDELPALSRLHRGDKYKFSTPLTIGNGNGQFASWQQLTPLVLPFHDLILHDRYLLRQSWAVRHNYPLLLEALVRGRRGKLNIVLMTLEPERDNTDSVDYTELRRMTKEVVTAETGEEPNFTVVWGENGHDVRHDRHIFTNYQWLASHDSFNYFNSNGSIRSEADTLTLHNLADSELRQQADELLSRIQGRITALLADDSAFVEGDRASSFLTF